MATVIHLDGVRKSYIFGDNSIMALKDVSLCVEAGEFTALKGPSGSGKSTLLNVCGLLDNVDAGSYRFIGESMEGLSSRNLADLRRTHIGFVFQGFNLVPVMSAYENVAYPLLLSNTGRKERRLKVDSLLERVGLSSVSNHRPDHLSGGQRQRVAIARALIKEPALVIADEPTANLDSDTATQMIDLMHELARENATTFLIATHDNRMAVRCDRVISLSDGAIQ